MSDSKLFNHKINRRTFLKVSAAVGAAAGFTGVLSSNEARANYGENPPDSWDESVKTVRTFCMMCNSACGIQVRVKDGVAIKIDGNPYCPQTNDYTAAEAEVALSDIPDADNKPSRVCAKSQAGLKTLYDPYRITRPLKRTGPRGSSQWTAISWKQALDEIANGGTLPNQSGTGTYTFAGLGAIRNLDLMDSSDADYPDEAPEGNPANLGPKANQFVVVTGRDQTGGTVSRFRTAFGSVNYISHESLCNSAFKLAGEHTYGTYHQSPAMQGNQKPDYLLIFGSSPLEARVPFVPWARWLMDAKAAGATVVASDVRMSALMAQARRGNTWLTVKPGTDAALAFGILRELMGTEVKTDYLSRPNQTAVDNMADGPGLRSYTNSTHLVWTSGPGVNKMVKANQLGGTHGLPVVDKTVVCTKVSKPLTLKVFDEPIGTVILEPGELTLTLANGTTATAKSAYTLLKDQVFSRKTSGWGTLCGISSTTISSIASDFAAAARPAVDFYRGAFAHTNGYYTARIIHMINVLMDRHNKTGGYGVAPSYAGGSTPIYPSAPSVPAAPNNVRIDRIQGYTGTAATPARMWYGAAKKGVQQEVYPSIKQGYPYKVKALMFYTSNPVYTLPYGYGGAGSVEDSLRDTAALPLAVSISIFMDETAANCDYILPDTTYLERFGNGNSGYGCMLTRARNIRRPVVGTYRDVTFVSSSGSRTARVYIPPGSALTGSTFGTSNGTEAAAADAFLNNWTGPMVVDDIMINLGKKLGLPGYGYNGFAPGDHYDTTYRYHDKVLSGDVGGGLGLAGEGNSGAPGDSTSAYVKMGGRRESPNQVYDSAKSGFLKNRLITEIKIYHEGITSSKNPYTGTFYSGVPIWVEDGLSLKGNSHNDTGYNYRMITYKMAWHVQSRSSSNEWLRELLPEGYIRINASDASALGIITGDEIKLTSAVNTTGVTGKAFVTETVTPGVVVVDHHYGRRWFGSQPYYVDGAAQPYDAALGGGAAASPVSRPDKEFGNLCLTDQVSGMAAYMSSQVKIEVL
jgi:anaerobic selenocysteine-containing dehydrogenase